MRLHARGVTGQAGSMTPLLAGAVEWFADTFKLFLLCTSQKQNVQVRIFSGELRKPIPNATNKVRVFGPSKTEGNFE